MQKANINSRYIAIISFLATSIMLSDCGPRKEKDGTLANSGGLPSVTHEPFGNLEGGKAVNLYIMRNRNGFEMRVMNYGGIVVSLKVPDRNGVIEDVTLGYDSLNGYVTKNPFFGALVGRYGNRIAKGKFALDGKVYDLPINNGANHLHGGPKGFDKVFWDIQDVSDSASAKLKLTYQSKDGEQGYPGNLNVEVYYSLSDDNEVRFEYTATTDKKTIVNLTQHTYFNLSGNARRDILGHRLTIDADKFLPIDETLIPTGILQPAAGTPFDFLARQIIGARIDENDAQLINGKGYDHCWALNNRNSFGKVATVEDSISGRRMEVFTNQPGIQFYSGNFLDGSITGKGGVVYRQHAGLCLETEHFPDSPNKKSFPPVVLSPGETYKTVTAYKFSVIR